ncbi:hypothetical protein PAHAL_4G198100 [Panicum hallii]|uniref:Uncharacterized protein n=1 Tax=Panicum hallii TaxID=206008 RepID=A0A2S3HJ56_9POAL|nr:hypothetical protein PAHAL_4G198100 [Panicum hallii]
MIGCPLTPSWLATNSSTDSSVTPVVPEDSTPCSSIFCCFIAGSSAEPTIPSVWPLFAVGFASLVRAPSPRLSFPPASLA